VGSLTLSFRSGRFSSRIHETVKRRKDPAGVLREQPFRYVWRRLSRTDENRARTGIACMATLAIIAAAFVLSGWPQWADWSGWLLALALLFSVWWQRAIRLEGSAVEGPAGPSTWPRRVVGGLIAALGAFVCYRASSDLLANWKLGFDRAWPSWLAATVFLSVGLDLIWARWSSPRRRAWKIAFATLALVALGALVRLGTFYFFPSPYYVTQVEELQVGAMANEALGGGRLRWEFLSQAWLGALGLTLGGPSLLAIRLPSTVISFLKIAPFFFWLRFSVGNTGAVVAAILLAISGWDSTFARVATNHNVFIVACAFALLNGPARRGRPSAYVWLGLFSGYVMFEYVLYRPLAVLAFAGAVMMSLRDRHAGWPARLLRPLLTLAVFCAMAWPLYEYVTSNGRTREFFDGYGRAVANQAYYTTGDSWNVAISKRLERARMAINLFYFRGPESPMTNPRGVPLADPFTAALLLLGTGYALAHPFRQLLGLTLAAAAITLGSALVLTGNFDYVRAGSAVGYVFALVGFGAASSAAALRGLERGWRVPLAMAVMVIGLMHAVAVNGSYLWFFVSSPEIRRAQFRELAYLSWWLGQSVKPETRAITVAPNFTYLMEANDASWLRPGVRGIALWDLERALDDWFANPPQNTFLTIYGGAASGDLRQYLAWLLPGVEFTRVPGPLGPDGDLLYADVPIRPADLEQRLKRWSCQPVKVSVDLINDREQVVETLHGSAGLIDATLWPGMIQIAFQRRRPEIKRARVQFAAEFEVKEAGAYTFPLLVFPGFGTVSVDGRTIPYPAAGPIELSEGKHHIELVSQYDPAANSPVHRLFWSGPDSGYRRELMPFYRISPEKCG